MSEVSDLTLFNIYEEQLNEDTVLDLSSRALKTVPAIQSDLISVIYLQNNDITFLPDDFFLSLPSLMWLDLRDNCLTELPKTIKNHPCLTHLLLQNNCLASLPNELSTVATLKVLQLKGNPLVYPPKEILNEGISKIIKYLHDKFIDQLSSQTDASEDNENNHESASQEGQSYNSVIDEEKIKKTNLSVQFNEKEAEYVKGDRVIAKCPRLAKSRQNIPVHYQSAKYVKGLYAASKKSQEERMKQSFLKDLTIKKHKDLLASREKILQNRKNIEQLKNWRQNYHNDQLCRPVRSGGEPSYPYDTSPECMHFLTREEIERDLPDKYRKRLVRRSGPTVPRTNGNDVQLAMKIKKLFENLEALDLNREVLTPRTEQKALLNEIEKISEIKQKLMELSTTNMRSVIEH